MAIGLAGFCAMRALSTRNDESERASRPVDQGSRWLCHERSSRWRCSGRVSNTPRHAARRFIARLIGYGLSADAYRMTASAARRWRSRAPCQLAPDHAKDSGPIKVDYVNAHATSTSLSDIAETAPELKTAFGDYAYKVSISPVKIDDRPLSRWRRRGPEMAACALDHPRLVIRLRSIWKIPTPSAISTTPPT